MFDHKIQVPTNSKVLIKARKRAKESGFSSINDVIRLILSQYAEGNIDFHISVPKSVNNRDSHIPVVSEEEELEIKRRLARIKDTAEDEIVERGTITI